MVAQAQSRPPGQTRLIPKKGQPFYNSWKDREQHMGIYKELDGTAGKCCDVGDGCSWTGCNHSRLSDADYRAWKARQKKSDEKYKGKGRNRTDVGPYRWAVCSQCIRQSRAKGIQGLLVHDQHRRRVHRLYGWVSYTSPVRCHRRDVPIHPVQA